MNFYLPSPQKMAGTPLYDLVEIAEKLYQFNINPTPDAVILLFTASEKPPGQAVVLEKSSLRPRCFVQFFQISLFLAACLYNPEMRTPHPGSL